MLQPKTTAQKEQFKKIQRRKNLEDYSWDSYTQRYLPKKFFYKNSSKPGGISTNNKFIQKANYDHSKFLELVNALPKTEQKLFV